jgi:BirA family transcriptional regulator, biotin operon repressor / biotin---[acetyl-CoA-carboxylase] ligase
MAILTFDTIDSTNNYLKLHANSLLHFTIVRARFQKAGRGQLMRQWQSHPNENLLVSFLIKDFRRYSTVKAIEAAFIQFCQSFFKHYGIVVEHKLPNDLMVNGKKIAGMLIETKQLENTLQYVILGVGLNINQTSFDHLPSATSLAILTKKTYPIDILFDHFVEVCSPLK